MRKCNNPYGHGHNYVLEVAVRGRLMGDGARSESRRLWTNTLAKRVLDEVDHRDLNRDVSECEHSADHGKSVRPDRSMLRNGWRQAFPGVGSRIAPGRRNEAKFL